jgi:hypothetical protein
VHTFEIRVLNSLGIDQFTFTPESDFGDFDGWGKMTLVDTKVKVKY